MAEGALADVRIVDFTHHITGPYCTKLFADYGADVIKIERPGTGDPARSMGPFLNDEPHPEKSGLFLHLNTNKRSVTLNLKNRTGQKIAQELIRGATCVAESFRPGVMASFGLDYENLKQDNPGLVMVSISNFGQTGPYRDYKASELVINGIGGDQISVGFAFREPQKLGDNVAQFQAGAAAATGTMGALLAAKWHGVGQHVDISIMETMPGDTPHRILHMAAYQFTGETSHRVSGPGSQGYPQGVYPCADGYVDIAGGRARFPFVVTMLGKEGEPLKDPKFYTDTAQVDPVLKEEFEEIFYPWLMSHTKREITEIGQAHRLTCAPLNTIEDQFNDPHFTVRGLFSEIEHPVAGKLKYPGRPFIMEKTPWQVRRPAPLLGQHNAEVLGELGYRKEDLVRLREQGVI